MTGRRIIVAAPRPVDDGKSGSVGRIRAMVAAFEALGYEVDQVMGRIDERLPALRRVERQLAAGVRYDFLYLENHTVPLHMTEPRLGLVYRHPLTDVRFLATCRRLGVPIGVFNRDVWWRFAQLRLVAPWYQRTARWPFHWLELLLYARLADVVFVPHLAMAEALPIRMRALRALPPGTNPMPASPLRASGPVDGPLRLFYVGGLGPFYQMHNLVDAVRRVEGVHLTICCRPEDWQRGRDSYAALMCDRVEVVHAHGPGLAPHFAKADILSCLIAPLPYWRVTLPIKLFEYLSHAKPLLAARATNAGTFIAEQGIGWAVEDDADQIAALLTRLRSRPAELAAMSARAAAIAPRHSWAARARQVAADLAACDRRPAGGASVMPTGARQPGEQSSP